LSSKPKIAVYKMSSCAGCQLEFLNLEPVLLELLGAVDIAYFVMAKRKNSPGPYDVGFVEGAITCGEEIEKLKKARKDCKVLVAMGACACTGGLPSMKNPMDQRDVEKVVYTELDAIHSTKAYGIDQYVPVDAYLRGCPVSRDELVDFIKALLLGITPRIRLHSVCAECKLKENECLFVTKSIPCMGPIVAAGCGALCPSLGRPCEGCRGPSNDVNAKSFAEAMMERGYSEDDVIRKFRKFAGNTPEFQKGVQAVWRGKESV